MTLAHQRGSGRYNATGEVQLDSNCMIGITAKKHLKSSYPEKRERNWSLLFLCTMHLQDAFATINIAHQFDKYYLLGLSLLALHDAVMLLCFMAKKG